MIENEMKRKPEIIIKILKKLLILSHIYDPSEELEFIVNLF